MHARTQQKDRRKKIISNLWVNRFPFHFSTIFTCKCVCVWFCYCSSRYFSFVIGIPEKIQPIQVLACVHKHTFLHIARESLHMQYLKMIRSMLLFFSRFVNMLLNRRAAVDGCRLQSNDIVNSCCLIIS